MTLTTSKYPSLPAKGCSASVLNPRRPATALLELASLVSQLLHPVAPLSKRLQSDQVLVHQVDPSTPYYYPSNLKRSLKGVYLYSHEQIFSSLVWNSSENI